MPLGHRIDLKFGEQEFLETQFSEGIGFSPKGQPNEVRTKIFVQINYVIISFRLQIPPELRQIPIIVKEFVDMWIMLGDRLKLFFGQEMNLGTRDLFFDATVYRTGEYDIANGRKSDHQYFHTVKLRLELDYLTPVIPCLF